MVLRVERNGQAMDLPMVPELAPTDNYGQIGVKLLANAEIRHRWVPCESHEVTFFGVVVTFEQTCIRHACDQVSTWMSTYGDGTLRDSRLLSLHLYILFQQVGDTGTQSPGAVDQ